MMQMQFFVLKYFKSVQSSSLTRFLREISREQFLQSFTKDTTNHFDSFFFNCGRSMRSLSAISFWRLRHSLRCSNFEQSYGLKSPSKTAEITRCVRISRETQRLAQPRCEIYLSYINNPRLERYVAVICLRWLPLGLRGRRHVGCE